MTMTVTAPIASIDVLQSRFLTIRPQILYYARHAFRFIRCPQQRQDLFAEVIAASWDWFVVMARRGEDATRFPAVLAGTAIKWVRGGRRVAGINSRDAMSEMARDRRGVRVTSMSDYLADALSDTGTPPPDAAAFRVDYRDWLRRQTGRRRRIIRDLARGERTLDTARRHGVSPARVSQMRREFAADWDRFVGDPVAA